MAHSADRDANQELRAVLDDVREQYARLKAGMGELQRSLAALQVTAESPDGLVRATVGPRGQLVDLYIDHRSYRTVDADELAFAIVATVREAVADTTEQVRKLVGDHLPADSDGLAFLPDGDFGRFLQRQDTVARTTATGLPDGDGGHAGRA